MGIEDRQYVEFIEVQKSYDGEILVVKNLNLSIRQGEFLTLLGPSGPPRASSSANVPPKQ